MICIATIKFMNKQERKYNSINDITEKVTRYSNMTITINSNFI